MKGSGARSSPCICGRFPNLDLELGQIARLSSGLSGADLRSLCERATRAAIYRAIESGALLAIQLEERDLQSALDEIRSRHRRHST